jgi:hypothetical protein
VAGSGGVGNVLQCPESPLGARTNQDVEEGYIRSEEREREEVRGGERQ